MDQINYLENRPPSLTPSETKSASQEQAKTVRSLKQIQNSLQKKAPPSSNTLPATATETSHTIKKVTVPTRKRAEAREIQSALAVEVAQIDKETNEAINQLGGDEQGVMTTFLLQERDHKVQAIKEEALRKKEALSNPAIESPTKTEERINPEDQTIEKLLQGYTTKLTAIEQEESEAIRKIENDPKATLRLLRDSSLSLRREIEKEREQKIEKVKQNTLDQKNLLFLKATKECRPYQKDFFVEVLRNYRKQLVLKSTIFIENQIDEIASKIEESFWREKEAIERALPRSTSTIFTEVIQKIEQEDQIRLSALQPYVQASITQNLKTLTTIEETLTHPLSLSHNQLSDPEKALELAKQLEKIRTDYFVAEAISTDLAQQVAEEAVNQLEQEIKKLTLRLKAATQEKELLPSNKSKTDDKKTIEEETISFYQNLQNYLQEAQQAYKQIALDCSLRAKDILEFKDHVAIFKQASMLYRQGSIRGPFNFQRTLSQQQINAENALVRTASTRIPTDLETTNFLLQRQVSGNFQFQRLERIASTRQNPLDLLSTIKETKEEESENALSFGLDFLEKLEEIPPEKDSYFLSGKRGEIELLSPTEADKNNTLEGLHLARLMVFRDYGPQGLARFDNHFQEKIRWKRPITLGELITFIDEENKINQSAYYLSPARSLKELIVGEPDKKEDDKLVKVESASFTFALTSHPQKTELSKKEIFKNIEGQVEKFFNKLPEPQRKKTLERFSQQFEETEEEGEVPLTVGNLRSFLIKEIERHQLEFGNVDITEMLFEHLSPHMETLYAGLIGAIGASTGLMIALDVAKSFITRLGVFRYLKSILTS